MHAMTMAFGSTFNDLDLCSLVSVSISARVINNLRSGTFHVPLLFSKKSKGCPYSITERMVPELIPVLVSQPAGDVSHKPGGRLPLLSAMPAVTPTTLKGAATNFAAW